MGLMDSDIESYILITCVQLGACWATNYPPVKVLPRIQPKDYTIKINGNIIYKGQYIKKYVRNDTFSFTER